MLAILAISSTVRFSYILSSNIFIMRSSAKARFGITGVSVSICFRRVSRSRISSLFTAISAEISHPELTSRTLMPCTLNERLISQSISSASFCAPSSISNVLCLSSGIFSAEKVNTVIFAHTSPSTHTLWNSIGS